MTNLQMHATIPVEANGPRSAFLLAEIRHEFPGFRIRYKQGSWSQRALSLLLLVCTFGAQRYYLTRYRTILGRTLWVPAQWAQTSDDEQWIVLCHERIHLRQARRLSSFGMAIVYILPILPVGLALGRALLEWEAYRETIAARAHVWGLASIEDPAFQAEIVQQFTTGLYGWMWPFPSVIRRWIAQAVAQESTKCKNAPMNRRA